MKNYAKIDDGFVETIIVAEQEFVDNLDGTWVQTCRDTRGGVHYEPDSETPSGDQSKALRKNYAGIGYVYDSTRDAFYEPQPYPSWLLNETTCIWETPVAYPDDGKFYNWDESTTSWVEVT
tara:strand:- start:36 stop:398 length:363 start_codon:yes stop_codon:yes gene_type:complete